MKIYLWESMASTYQTKYKVNKFSGWRSLLDNYIAKKYRSSKGRKYAIYAEHHPVEARQYAQRLVWLRNRPPEKPTQHDFDYYDLND
jgi:hypothetical protein